MWSQSSQVCSAGVLSTSLSAGPQRSAGGERHRFLSPVRFFFFPSRAHAFILAFFLLRRFFFSAPPQKIIHFSSTPFIVHRLNDHPIERRKKNEFGKYALREGGVISDVYSCILCVLSIAVDTIDTWIYCNYPGALSVTRRTSCTVGFTLMA